MIKQKIKEKSSKIKKELLTYLKGQGKKIIRRGIEAVPSGPISTPRKKIKIAITGLSRSGKTVFITSLIDQLLKQNKILSFTESHPRFHATIQPPRKGIKRFNYFSMTEDIKKNYQWPKSTDSISSITIDIEIKSRFKWKANRQLSLDIVDYPGEWILDLTLLEKNFETWSKETIEYLSKIDHPASIRFLNSLKDAEMSAGGIQDWQELCSTYKKTLATLKKGHYFNLTPGRFLMPGDMASDPALDFAPLRSDRTFFYSKFKENYTNYVNNITKKIHFDFFQDFDRQIVLVDVIEALQHGPACYTDMKGAISAMMSAYDHSNKNFVKQWINPSIRRTLFVASKADLVAASQHTNYDALLKELTEDIRRKLDISHVKTSIQIVSSVRCATSLKKKIHSRQLYYVRGLLAGENSIKDLYPGEMPSSFPAFEHWDTSDYMFREFMPPKRDYKENEALQHIYMENVIEKILGDLI